MIITANLSDASYGWHGSRTGIAVYYSHYLQEHNEDQEQGSLRKRWLIFGRPWLLVFLWSPGQELTLTSSMVLASSLTMTRTTLLGNPYTPCSYQNNGCNRFLIPIMLH